MVHVRDALGTRGSGKPREEEGRRKEEEGDWTNIIGRTRQQLDTRLLAFPSHHVAFHTLCCCHLVF